MPRYIPRDTFLRLSRSSAGEVLFPRLERLCYHIEETDVPPSHFHLFFPPRLKIFALYRVSSVPSDQVAVLVHIISFLTNSLHGLTLKFYGQRREPLLEDAMSSFVCRHGSLLRHFGSDIPLSEAATHHLMQLPNLRFWVATQKPPRTLPPVAFPSLESLHLQSAALPWLHLLASHKNNDIQSGFSPPTSRANLRETLKFLDCPRGTVIDSTFSSSVANFWNLVGLRVGECCSGTEGCISQPNRR